MCVTQVISVVSASCLQCVNIIVAKVRDRFTPGPRKLKQSKLMLTVRVQIRIKVGL